MQHGLTRALVTDRPSIADDKTDRRDLGMLAGGDPSALERIFDRHHQPVYRFASRMLGDAEDAADATQDAFLRLARAPKRADKIRCLRAWLIRVVQNGCRDRFRRRRRLPWPLDESRDEPAKPAGASIDALAVRDALRSLPVDQAAAVVLRFYFDYSYRDIAEVQGIAEGSARARACRGLKRLRDLLVETGGVS